MLGQPVIQSHNGEEIVLDDFGGHSDKLEDIVRLLLHQLGLDTTDEHLLETPRRVAAYMRSFRQDVDLVALLKEGFENNSSTDAIVVQDGIPIAGLCSHHLAPWFGKAYVGYLPNHRICGLSKLTRVAQAAGKVAPSTQEAVTNLVADTINDGLDAKGVIVVTKCVHTCMAVRGVYEQDVQTTVSAVRGLMLTSAATRQEFFELLKIGGYSG
jgi:GTP cyclohydrolase I